jgi:CRP/FNR family transcriptional regulator, cyclic AMP receptor protein
MPGRNAPIALIWKIKLFAGLTDKELGAVAAPFQDESFEAGAVVVEEGTTGSGFFVMESGRAIVSVRGQELRELGPGDHFGEIALIADSPRTATVTAATNLRCHTISRDDFRKIVEAQPSIAWKLLENLAREFVSLRQSVD